MKTEAVKLELIQWLSGINDEDVLASILRFKKNVQKYDWADDLTPSQVKQIEEGLEDIRKGRTIPSKEVWKKYGRKV